MRETDVPSVSRSNGHKEWHKNGKPHRDNGPAIVYVNGDKEWYKNGILHRDNGPAIIKADGAIYYYNNGRIHNEDGPAIIEPCSNGMMYSWFINGRRIIASIKPWKKDDIAIR